MGVHGVRTDAMHMADGMGFIANTFRRRRFTGAARPS